MPTTNKNNGTHNKIYNNKRGVKRNRLMNKEDKKQNHMGRVYKKQQLVMAMAELI